MEVVVENYKRKGRPVHKKRPLEALERWKSVPGINIPKDQKRFEKMAKRLNHYEAIGQYRDGVFYCKLGKAINEVRIMQYEGMCHKLVRSFLPALVLWEAGFMYEDLIVMCKREIFLALLDGFDPVKALTSNSPDPIRKAEVEKWKQENQQEAYVKAEKLIVYGRISQFLRRERYKYHPKQLGGKTISRELLLYSRGEVQNKEYQLGMYCAADQSWMTSPEIYDLKEDLLKVLEKEGVEYLRERFHQLNESQKEELVEFLHQNSASEWSAVSNYMDGNVGEACTSG